MTDSFETLEYVLTAYHLPYVVKSMNELFKYDKNVHIHSLHVSTIATQLGSVFGLPKERLLSLAAGGLLHDIGKMDIPLEIINKKGRLTGEEYDIIKKHSLNGFIRLQKEDAHPASIDYMVLFHHYYLDGSGYPQPRGELQDFKGKEPLLETQIITVCDIFCALVSPRSYKRTYSYRKALWKLKRMAKAGALNETIVQELAVLVRDNMLLLNTTGDIGLTLP